MTADIRTAARDEAFQNYYSHKQVRDRYDADLLITGFMDGAVWGARKHGQIKAERDELHEVAMALGVNPDDVRAMGLMWAASGMSVEDAERAARNFSRYGASIMKEDHGDS